VIRIVTALVAATALAGALIAYLVSYFGSSGGPRTFVDLDYYRAALEVVVAQQPLYAALPYPPFAVLVIAPLGGLPVVLGNALWTVATLIVGIVLAVVMTWRSTRARHEEYVDRWELLFRGSFAALLLLISMPMFSQLSTGQVTLFVVALSFFDITEVVPPKARGILVGVAGAIKLTPLIFIPYFLVTGQRRQAVVATASFGAATALGFAMFPSDSLFFWSHLGKNDQFGDPARLDNLSIHSALMRWLPAAGEQTLMWVGCGLVVAVFAMVRARKHFLAGERMEAALTVAASAVVLAPIAWPHYHVWVVLVALWLVTFPQRRHQVIGVVIFVAYSMPFLIWGQAFFDILVLIPVLIGLFGLPHRPAATSKDLTAPHPEAVPTAA
jgi:alpha-1,2-mannosyltransferase